MFQQSNTKRKLSDPDYLSDKEIYRAEFTYLNSQQWLSFLSAADLCHFCWLSEVHTLPHLNLNYCSDAGEVANSIGFTSTVEEICVSTGIIAKIIEFKFILYPMKSFWAPKFLIFKIEKLRKLLWEFFKDWNKIMYMRIPKDLHLVDSQHLPHIFFCLNLFANSLPKSEKTLAILRMNIYLQMGILTLQ